MAVAAEVAMTDSCFIVIRGAPRPVDLSEALIVADYKL